MTPTPEQIRAASAAELNEWLSAWLFQDLTYASDGCQDYASSWSGLGQVVELMRARGYWWAISARGHDNESVEVSFIRDREARGNAVDVTAPLAGARAALLASVEETPGTHAAGKEEG